MENIIADTWDVFDGFNFKLGCNYPEAFLTPEVIVTNLTLFVSSDNLTSFRPNSFKYFGPGNITVNNVNVTHIYNLEKLGKSIFLIAQETDCTPDDGELQILQFHNVISSLRG